MRESRTYGSGRGACHETHVPTATAAREFITLLGGAVAWPIAARAQDGGAVRRIGVLMSNAETDPEALARVGALEQGLRKLGWSQGRNISLSYRWNVADAESVRTSVRDLMDEILMLC